MTDPAALEALKRQSTLQVLFKVSRLANEEAIRRVRAVADDRVRTSHTALFPHVPFDGIRLTALAARLKVTKQAAQQLVDELVELGLFERLPDPTDGRAKLICWTPRGLAALQHGLGVLGGLERELAQVVGHESLAELHQLLTMILAHLERPDDPLRPT